MTEAEIENLKEIAECAAMLINGGWCVPDEDFVEALCDAGHAINPKDYMAEVKALRVRYAELCRIIDDDGTLGDDHEAIRDALVEAKHYARLFRASKATE